MLCLHLCANPRPVALNICAPIHETTFFINWFWFATFFVHQQQYSINTEFFHKKKAGCLTTAGGYASKSEAFISSQENGARSPDPPSQLNRMVSFKMRMPLWWYTFVFFKEVRWPNTWEYWRNFPCFCCFFIHVTSTFGGEHNFRSVANDPNERKLRNALPLGPIFLSSRPLKMVIW